MKNPDNAIPIGIFVNTNGLKDGWANLYIWIKEQMGWKKNTNAQEDAVIINGDCLIELPKLADKSFDLVVADPPFSICYKYDIYKDNLNKKEYLDWSHKWITLCYQKLKDNGSMFIFIGPKFCSEIDVLSKEVGLFKRNHILWTYNFGSCQKKKFSPCSTHILYYVKNEKNFNFYADAVKIPSLRQTKYGDKRAANSGKVPGDIWEYPRICGTFKERTEHPAQTPEFILDRIVKCCTIEGDSVLDPLAGSGTTLAVCRKLNRNCTGIELSPNYCKIIQERLDKIP